MADQPRGFLLYNLTLTGADTEYSQDLMPNCQSFEFQARTNVEIRFAFATGYVATPTAPYATLKAGDYYYSLDLNTTGTTTLYFASATAGTVVEIVASY